MSLEDDHGMSALEHAILSDAPMKVVKLLQWATKKCYEYLQAKGTNTRNHGSSSLGASIMATISSTEASDFSMAALEVSSPHTRYD